MAVPNDQFTEISCRMSDCIYYHCATHDPLKAICRHKDAPRYLHTDPPCPLYQLDWQKKVKASAAMLTPHPLAKRKF